VAPAAQVAGVRELKFRAWDPEAGQFASEIQIGTPNIAIEVKSMPNSFVLSNKTQWTQYTGLHDKNGVEIYEGDVVRICRSYGYGFLPKGATAEVSWSDSELCYFLRGSYRLTKNKQLEVIGNIYETPELLKAGDE
jgi:hypothetical protein